MSLSLSMPFDSQWSAVLAMLIVGFLPTEIWRSLSVLAGRRVQEGSEIFLWVKAVASALLAAVIARLILAPTGALAEIPLLLRLACVAGGIGAFALFRRSVLAGVVTGEALLVGSVLLLGL